MLSSHPLLASPFGLPVGLQLYSVRELLAKDYEGTLKQVAAAGYAEVEAAGFYNRTAQGVQQAMRGAGLRCVSAHYSYTDLNRDLDSTIAFNRELGSEYVICSYPGYKNAASAEQPHTDRPRSFTIEDFRWNAEQFNRIGARVKAAGMKFGYHNHTMEFRPQDGVVPFDELMRLTDPSLVTLEMDCGWVIVGGGDPVQLLNRYPTRISMLHVKDFKPTPTPASTPAAATPVPAELGQGTIDFRPIFAAAKKADIRHYFVEQEAYDMPVFESLKIDAEYMKSLSV